MDVLSIYDDYPVMVLAQLQDLGFFRADNAKQFIHESIATGRVPLNTSGGQLSAGQAGAACSLHGLVEVMRQLSGQAGERQVAQARYGLVTGYGMV
ncbi:thiolase C-terminal domain-containing protein, partial [Klebsiella pneumoniae]